MKKILLPMSLVLLFGCASKEVVTKSIVAKPLEIGRKVTSFESECKIVKHNSKDKFRLTMYGKTYNNYWYEEDEVELLYQRFVSQGRCK